MCGSRCIKYRVPGTQVIGDLQLLLVTKFIMHARKVSEMSGEIINSVSNQRICRDQGFGMIAYM